MALLDVVLGYDCNLACDYCTISPEMRKRAMSTERVAREIERAASRGFRDVAFTGGEPTIRADLPALIKLAKRRGFEHVKVASNGLRYAHAPYLDHLVSCGVDRFNVSLHAMSDTDYERTVQLAGTAQHRRLAIKHLVDRALDPTADLIVKTDTAPVIDAWIASLVDLGLRRFALWLVSLTDHNAPNTHQLPSISSIVPHVLRAFDNARRGGYEVTALHIPRCFVPGYEEHIVHPGADLVTVVTPDDVFDLKDSRLGGGVKAPACSGCAYESTCPGVRRDYADRFGFGELRTVYTTP